MKKDYVFGNGLRLLFKAVSSLRGLVSNPENNIKTFETLEMVNAPFDKWEKYLLRLKGVDSDGSEEYYLGANRDEKGRIWHRFVLSTLESDLLWGWPLCVTNVCEDSYKIKDNAVHIEGHNWSGLQIPLDSTEGKGILMGWMANRKKESYRKAI